MSIIAATNEKQKKEVIAASEACNLSQSAFIKLAVKEKIRRMEQEGIKIGDN